MLNDLPPFPPPLPPGPPMPAGATAPSAIPYVHPPAKKGRKAGAIEGGTPVRTARRSETGTWPCDLDGCGKVFAREADLKRHQRTTKSHQSPGQSVGSPCPLCDSTFTRSDAMRRHLKSRHSGKATTNLWYSEVVAPPSAGPAQTSGNAVPRSRQASEDGGEGGSPMHDGQDEPADEPPSVIDPALTSQQPSTTNAFYDANRHMGPSILYHAAMSTEVEPSSPRANNASARPPSPYGPTSAAMPFPDDYPPRHPVPTPFSAFHHHPQQPPPFPESLSHPVTGNPNSQSGLAALAMHAASVKPMEVGRKGSD